MTPYRSMLFVPGHKPDWADKAIASGADAIILDLEDAVPQAGKASARRTVRATIDRLHESSGAASSAASGVALGAAAPARRADVWVRPNGAGPMLHDDLDEVVAPGLAGLLLPKVASARDIVGVDAVLSFLEARRGLPPGSVRLIATFETAAGIAHCEEIAAAAPRLASVLGTTGPDGDVSHELGFEFSAEGSETLYVRSRILLAARANGLHHPLAGVWQDIADVDGFRRFALDNRRLGYRGVVVIHPSHVAPAHDVFTPSAETVAYYRRLLDAFRAGEAAGNAAVDFEGRHIDLAHARTAEAMIALAASLPPE